VGVRTMMYAVTTAAIVALIVFMVGQPRRSLRSDDSAAAVQPTEALARVADPVSAIPPQVIVTPPSRTSPAASTAALVKKTTKVDERVATPTSTPRMSTRSTTEASGTAEPAANHVDAAPAVAATSAATPRAETSGVAPVTVTGCLEVSVTNDRFRLTETEGGGVSKARSWRTGFLKKRSPSVDLVGPAGGVSLDGQVGKRVAATGVLRSHTLTVGSIRVVAPNCD
jgi:hypothetical protein